MDQGLSPVLSGGSDKVTLPCVVTIACDLLFQKMRHFIREADVLSRPGSYQYPQCHGS